MRISSLLTTPFLALSVAVLSACSNASLPTASSTSPSAIASPTGSTSSPARSASTHGGQGGQVIETGVYHLEFIAAPEATGTHLDFFLQRGDGHAPVPNATVTA
jgi:hypothetical protein